MSNPPNPVCYQCPPDAALQARIAALEAENARLAADVGRAVLAAYMHRMSADAGRARAKVLEAENRELLAAAVSLRAKRDEWRKRAEGAEARLEDLGKVGK